MTKNTAQNKAAKGPTKRDLVRQALADLGKDAKPLQIREHVKQKFGTELSIDLISPYKSELAPRKKTGKKAVAKPSALPKQQQPTKPDASVKASTQPKASAPAKTPAKKSGSEGIGLDDIRLVKKLLGTVVAKHLQELIDLLAR